MSKKGTKDHASLSAPPGADSWCTYQSGKACKLQVYQGELQLVRKRRARTNGNRSARSAPGSDKPPKRSANDITTFSFKSRIRLFKRFNRLQTPRLGSPIFLSLTAAPEILSTKDFQYTFHKIFLPRIKKIIPKLVYLWRLEPHKNGRPHFHAIFWSYEKERQLSSEYYKRQIRKVWRLAIGDNSRAAELYSCKIKAVKDRGHLRAYLSKYLAKEDQGKSLQVQGRRWGTSKNFPANPITEVILDSAHLKHLVDAVLAHLDAQDHNTEWVRERIDNGDPWSLWLDPREVAHILKKIHDPPSFNRYCNFQEHAKITPPEADLIAIAEAYGIDY